MPVVTDLLPPLVADAAEQAYTQLVRMLADGVAVVDAVEATRIVAAAGRSMRQFSDDVIRRGCGIPF